MKDLYEKHKLPVICALLGLITGLLFITIGFFQTLLVYVLTILGAYLGKVLDETGLYQRFLNRMRQ